MNWFDFKTYLTWRTVLDISLISFLLYQVLSILKGTRAAQILTGLFFLFLFYIGTSLLELETIGWIINKFYSSFIFIVIVLFQDDLRRLLTRLGKGPFFGFDQDTGLDVIDEIVNASKTLSHERFGAIFVFERGVGLEKMHDHSVYLDAIISEQLLVAIFQGFSPLHDGAVIIKKSRLFCASAQLPLSKNSLFNKRLGTRHSASVGISEETDAVVLVVSEETGGLSIAIGGQLHKQSSPEAAKRALVKFLQLEKNPSKKTFSFMKIDFGAIRSLLFAWTSIFDGKRQSKQNFLDPEMQTMVQQKDLPRQSPKFKGLLRFSRSAPNNLVVLETPSWDLSQSNILESVGTVSESKQAAKSEESVSKNWEQSRKKSKNTHSAEGSEELRGSADFSEFDGDEFLMTVGMENIEAGSEPVLESFGTSLNQAAIALSKLKKEDKFEPPAPPSLPPELDAPIGGSSSESNEGNKKH